MLNSEKIKLILIFFFFILLTSLTFNQILIWDENVYLANARSHIAVSNYKEDFRFPLLEWFIAFIWLPFGESIVTAKILMMIFSLMSIFISYLIFKRFCKCNFLATLSFSISPLMISWATRIYPDIPAMFFVLLSFYLILKKRFSLSGAASGLAFLMKFPMILFPFSMVLSRSLKKREILIFATGFFISICPWLIYNQLSYSDMLWDLKEQFRVVQIWTKSEPFVKFFSNMFFHFGLICLLLPYSLYFAFKKNLKLPSIYTLISIIFYSFFVNLKDPRYLLAFSPFLFLIVFSTLPKKHEKKICIALLINILLITFFNIHPWMKNPDCSKAIYQSFEYLKGKNVSTILSNIWVWYGYHLNVNAFSFWDEDITKLLVIHKPDYVIYSDIGMKFNREILEESKVLVKEKTITDACQNLSIYKPIQPL